MWQKQTKIWATALIWAALAGWQSGSSFAQEKSLTFYLPFEEDATAVVAGGDPNPVEKSVPGKLVHGIKGNGMLLDSTTLLRYAIPGNHSNARGSLELWIKFLSADDTSVYHYLFYEEGPHKNGSQIIRVFTLTGGTELYYSFYTLRSRWSSTPFVLQDIMGEWHHIVITWDKDIGDRIYVDGKFRDHRGGTCRTIVHNYQRGTKQHEKMVIGLRKTKASIVLDEVKIYNRMLSEEEVARNYQNLFPLKMKAKPVIFHQGKSSSVTIPLTNTQNREVKGDLTYQITDKADDVITKGGKPNITVRPRKTIDIPVPFTPEEAGKYRIVYTFSGLTNLSRSANLYALPKMETAGKKETHPELKLKLIKAFDCTKDYGPDEYCDDGLTRIVVTPFGLQGRPEEVGKYRETGEKPWSRFAYRFYIDEPYNAYLAVVEYPDDKERVMEIMIDNKTNRAYQTIENGLIMGGEFPNSNKFHEFRLLFFPPDKECTIQIMNWPIGGHWGSKRRFTSAACKSIKIYKVLGGIPAVALHNLPPQNKQRTVGFEIEDCMVITREFSGNLAGGPGFRYAFEDIYRAFKDRSDYMAFLGQNLYVYPLIHYTGATYPSEVTGQAPGYWRSHPDFWVDLALELFHQKGIKFISSICLWVNPELAKEACLGPDQEGVARGEDTVRQVAWNGELSALTLSHNVQYDILNPTVEKTILTIVDDILNSYGDHPAFGGISFWLGPWPFNSIWFDSLKWGYSDRDISLFEKETGIKVPGKSPDSKRFLKRYVFLVKKDEKMKEKWVAWRCKKVKELWMKIYHHVQAKNPEFKLIVENYALHNVQGGDNCRHDHWKPGDLRSIYTYYRNGGLDLDLYKDIPNFYIGKVQYHNARPPDELWYWRDFEFAPASIEPFRNKGQNALWLEQDRREFDLMKHATELPGYWWKDEKGNERVPAEKSGAIMAHGDFYLEYYANAMANFDACQITDGGITTTTLGHEKELSEFIRAYRTLPAEYFAVFGNVDDPLCVRYRERKDGHYFYLVNREFYPIEAKLSFSANKPFALLDLPADEKTTVRKKGGVFQAAVTVGPFRLRSFKIPSGVTLDQVQVEVPEKNVAWLKEKVDTFHHLLTKLEALPKKEDLDEKTEQEINWVSQEIDQAYAEGRYSRLRHLLFSFQARKLKRILEDETLRAYLTVPKSYREKFYGPLEVKAKKVAKIPGIESELWQQSIATSMFSEVMRIEGKFQPRPAEERTTVSILYDEDKIGILFQCFDQEVAKVTAKQVERDGNVIGPDDDSVEVFLSHAQGNQPYYHFLANFGGSIKDQKKPGGLPAWYDPEWTIETRKGSASWLARMVIPFQALEKKAQPGEVWGANLCRNVRGRYFTFRCDPQKGFHCPDYFARLRFE